MRTLQIDLLPDIRADTDRIWHAHAAARTARGSNDGWTVRFGPGDAEADAVLTVPTTSWVHWTALFAFMDAAVPCRGPGGSSLAFRGDGDEPPSRVAPCLSFGPDLEMGFDEGDACDPWGVFMVRADHKVSFRLSLVLSALYSKQPHASLPELAGEAIKFYDKPETLFESPERP